MAELLVNIFLIYLGVGLLFAVAFAIAGARRVDSAAKGSSLGFRLIIIPAAMALWPLLAARWAKGMGEPPTETNPHRQAAAGGAANSGNDR